MDTEKATTQIQAGRSSEWPSEYFLQLHVAVANIGGRKGLLSKLQLLRFADEHGATVTLPEVPLPLPAHLYRLHSVQGQGRGVVAGP